MSSMTDKVALVVGGARGIGLAISSRLAREGAEVYLTGRDAGDTEAAASGIGARAHALVADASIPAEIASAVETVHAQAGRIDALVINAGISEPSTMAETSLDHFDRHFALNVRGPLFALQAAAKVMPDGGAVVLIGSIADVMGFAAYGTYCATKAALRSYARSWAAELAPRAIRVNVVSPGPIETAMFAAVGEEGRAAMLGQIPLRRIGRPEEVASAASFLLSGESGFVTGAELCVDGGMKQV